MDVETNLSKTSIFTCFIPPFSPIPLMSEIRRIHLYYLEDGSSLIIL